MAALGETCADRADRSGERADLLQALRSAKDPATGQSAANAVWAFWADAPDDRAQALLDRGMASIQRTMFKDAEKVLDELIAYCPDYPEGWNQRAFARFLDGRFDESLADIEEVLRREPSHFGALAGQVQIYVRQGRSGLAQLALKRAVGIHPWLGERSLLDDPGQDI